MGRVCILFLFVFSGDLTKDKSNKEMQSMDEKSLCKRIRKFFVLWSGLFVCQTYTNAKWQLCVYIFSASVRPTNVPKCSLQSCNYRAHSPAYCNWSLQQNWNSKERNCYEEWRKINKWQVHSIGLPKLWYFDDSEIGCLSFVTERHNHLPFSKESLHH